MAWLDVAIIVAVIVLGIVVAVAVEEWVSMFDHKDPW